MGKTGKTDANNISTGSLRFLDGLRGLAALYVMIGHARWLLWEGGGMFQQHASSYSSAEKFQVYFFSLFKYGHEAVLFFFVLSGFVIHLKQARAIQRGRETSLDGYFLRRVRRILPPFLFALLLTFCCDKIIEWMHASIFTHSTPDPVANANIFFDHSAVTLAGNILFLQATYVPVFGSNAPLWSLKYEWWFYMLYPLMLLINKRSPVLSLLAVALLSGVAIVGWSWGIKLIDDVFAYFFCWWLGCFSADIFAGRLRFPAWSFALAGCCLIFIPISAGFVGGNTVIKDSLVAIGFMGLLNSLIFLQEKKLSLRFLEKLKPLGDCSYSLYVIHLPLLVLGNAILLTHNQNQLPRSMTFVWISIIVIPVISYLIHFLVERPFVVKGNKLRQTSNA
jgi:peptidoglycan/LPS O-acetylase OafA/YrhL